MNEAIPPDMALMMAVREGDRQAFAALHERHQRRVLGFFYVLSRDAVLANDLCQETFLRVWRIRKRYRATGPFAAYLFAVARLVWREHVRSEVTRGLGPGQTLDAAPEPVSPAGQRPDRVAARTEFADSLWAALEALPEAQRLVFVLRYVRGLSIEEIAGALDCPVNTVRSRKLLAIKRLRHLLAPWALSAPGRLMREG